MLRNLFVVLALIMSSHALAESVSGNITVSLTILPSNGCFKSSCTINVEEILSKMKNNKLSEKNFYVEKKENELIITF